MDMQHRKWLDMLNSFYSQIGEDGMQERVVSLIDGVLDYTHYHFSEEEKLLDSMGYPAVGEQKGMHNDIIDTIQDFREKAVNGKLIVSLSLTSELKRWFREHILIEDKKYAEYYRDNK